MLKFLVSRLKSPLPTSAGVGAGQKEKKMGEMRGGGGGDDAIVKEREEYTEEEMAKQVLILKEKR